jgi:predicted transcriptional regulator
MNDGGLLILDETSKLSKYTISHLTRIRSEGIAEIHKIQSYVTPARVRTIFIFNPANGKIIAQYPYGIMAITSVFKDPATISRLDYVLVVSKDEADIDMVNKARSSVPLLYSQELERNLIYWTWSLKESSINFSDKAVDRIYMLALDLASKYDVSTLPLIQGENIRYKLAKIAACFAARVYSTKYSGKWLFVDAVHVECAWIFLDLIYKKRDASYFTMSKIHNNLNKDNEQHGLVAIQKYFASFYSKRYKVLEVLLSNDTITMSDISEQADINKDTALEIVSKLVKNRLIERSGFVYVKTALFNEWLRDEVSKQITR